MQTGPRPMAPAERVAYTLHLQQVPLATIEEQTQLSRPRIAAAVDLGRLHAQAAMQPAAADTAPATAPKPPARTRKTTRPRPPVASVPPTPARSARARRPAKPPKPVEDFDERIRVLTALVDVMRKHEAKYIAELDELLAAQVSPEPEPEAVLVDEPVAEPKSAAAPAPDLTRSSKVRAWALTEGWTVPPGRLPGAIVLAYQSAHRGDL